MLVQATLEYFGKILENIDLCNITLGFSSQNNHNLSFTGSYLAFLLHF